MKYLRLRLLAFLPCFCSSASRLMPYNGGGGGPSGGAKIFDFGIKMAR
jgi:hypothetical protein